MTQEKRIDFNQLAKPANLQNSAVLRMLEEEEERKRLGKAGTEERIGEILKRVWRQEGLNSQVTGEKVAVILPKKQFRNCYVALSALKIVKIGQWLNDEEVCQLTEVWPKEKDIVEIPIHYFCKSIEYVTMEMLQNVMDKMDRKHEERTHNYLGQLVKSQEEFITRQALIQENVLEKVVGNIMVKMEQMFTHTSIRSTESRLQIKDTENQTEKRTSSDEALPNIVTEDEAKSPKICELEEKERPKPKIINIEVLSEEQSVPPLPKNNLEFTHEEIQRLPFFEDDLQVKSRESHVQTDEVCNQSGSEEGEIREFMEIEDWDSPTGKTKIEVPKGKIVSKPLLINKQTNENVLTKDCLIKLIENNVNTKVNSILKDKDKVKSNSNVTDNLSEKILMEILNKDSSTNRNYKLNNNVKFEVFEDFLISELVTKKLDYILKGENQINVNLTKLAEDKHKVREIIINHIDMCYYTKVTGLREPIEIIEKLKEFKRLETKTNSITAKRDVYMLKYNPNKESASEFCEKFEDKVNTYDNISKETKISNKEKRDLFVQAVAEKVPNILIADCVSRETTGQEMSFVKLKNYLLQIEGVMTKSEPPKTAMFTHFNQRNQSVRGRSFFRGNTQRVSLKTDRRCFSCGKNGHISNNCPTPGLIQCYSCNKTGSHVAKDCPKRKAEMSKGDYMPTKRQKVDVASESEHANLRSRGFSSGRGRGVFRTVHRRQFRRGRGRSSAVQGTSMLAESEYSKGLKRVAWPPPPENQDLGEYIEQGPVQVKTRGVGEYATYQDKTPTRIEDTPAESRSQPSEFQQEPVTVRTWTEKPQPSSNQRYTTWGEKPHSPIKQPWIDLPVQSSPPLSSWTETPQLPQTPQLPNLIETKPQSPLPSFIDNPQSPIQPVVKQSWMDKSPLPTWSAKPQSPIKSGKQQPLPWKVPQSPLTNWSDEKRPQSPLTNWSEKQQQLPQSPIQSVKPSWNEKPQSPVQTYSSWNNQQDQQSQQPYKQPPNIQAYFEPPPSVITLRPEPPISQAPAPVFQAQPAAVNPISGSMRGDQKWPPASVKEQTEAENRARLELAKGPVCRPRRVNKDYSGFFAQHALTNNYPGYRAPPGTQYFTPAYHQ